MISILKIDNVVKNYKKFKLDNIQIDIEKGKIIGLIGENGAGKTTLIKIILNQVKRDSGNIEIFGLNNITEEMAIKKRLGVVLDECYFHGSLNANNISNIMIDIFDNWNKDYFNSLLGRFDIDKSKNIKEYSKGMKNKLMLSITLSHYPEFLILDEITSGLDPVVRNEVLLVLKDYVKENNATVLFSTHIISDIEKIADKIIFLHNGQIIFNEETNLLKNKYKVLKCNSEKYNELIKENTDIENYIKRQDENILLLKNDLNFKEISNLENASIEDIMLFYIKGESKI